MEYFPLQPDAENHLLQFARHGALLREEDVFRELLRDRGAALRDAAMQDVRRDCAHDAECVDTPVRIEAAVFDRQERLRQMGRKLAQRDGRAAHLAARREHASVQADDLDRGRTLRHFERLDRRQMRRNPSDHADRPDEAPQAEHDRPIGDTPDQRAAAAALLFRLALFLPGLCGAAWRVHRGFAAFLTLVTCRHTHAPLSPIRGDSLAKPS